MYQLSFTVYHFPFHFLIPTYRVPSTDYQLTITFNHLPFTVSYNYRVPFTNYRLPFILYHLPFAAPFLFINFHLPFTIHCYLPLPFSM